MSQLGGAIPIRVPSLVLQILRRIRTVVPHPTTTIESRDTSPRTRASYPTLTVALSTHSRVRGRPSGRRCALDESDFEGTLVLERLASIGRLDDFFDAVDADDTERATALMKKANLDANTIALVVKKIEDADGDP